MAPYGLGIDVGGTFTDVVGIDAQGATYTAKATTTPGDQAAGMLDGIDKIAARLGLSTPALLADTDIIVHGTTVGTNIMLEFNGAGTYMLTTRGMRDILDLRRNYKEAAFSLRLPPPHSIVPRRRRIPITERLTYAGEVVLPLAEDEVRQAAERLGSEGAEAVAVCYLFSFVNPAHELRTREILRAHLPGLHISLSHEVLPRIREFERFSTAVVDAYVTPALGSYLSRLEGELRTLGFTGDLLVMRSNGGVAEAQRARKTGVHLVASGPAGGVVAAAQLGAAVDVANLITMDMGGTSCDVSLIEDGKPKVGLDSWISRHRVSVPALDITSIGAGGGSIVWVDNGGALRIGPQSAGARPGPACYGRGGTEATVTDADLVLGYINPAKFLGGSMPLDPEAARQAIERAVAARSGMSVAEAAAAIFRVVNHNMANALRLVSIAKGYDPRDFALMAFGGGGPVHAAALVSELDIRRILIPRRYAPVLCALGDVLSDIRESAIRGFYGRSGSVDLRQLDAAFVDLREKAEESIGAKARQFPGTVQRAIGMRYKGQTHEVVVPMAADPITDAAWAATLEDFHRLHRERYSFNRPGVETEIISLHLDRWAARPKSRLDGDVPRAEVPRRGPKAVRDVYVPSLGRYVPAEVYDGEAITPGFSAPGPLVVEEPHTSVVVFPGQVLSARTSYMYAIETLA